MTTTEARPVKATPLKALLAGEIAISIVLNIAFNLVFAWLLFPIEAPVELWGARGLAVDVLPASFVPAVMMTLAVTTILRGRIRRGLSVAGAVPPPFRLPRSLLPRAIVIGLFAVVVVGLPTIGLLALTWSGPWSWFQLALFKLAFSVVHAAVVTPVVVLAAIERSH